MTSSHFTLVVEDEAQYLFLYRLLKHWGVIQQRIRRIAYPAGKGSGEQHVRLKLPAYLRETRRAANRKFVAAMTDADTRTVTDRRQQLDTECGNQDEAPMDDAGVLLIPKRHIETWLTFFETGAADEQTDYDHAFDAELAQICRAVAPKVDIWLESQGLSGPPSLLAARPDLLRLRAAARS